MAQDDFKEFVERVRQAESRGQRYGKDGKLLTSPKGAQGEMQVMPATQRRPGFGITPIRDDSPDEIARVGRDLLKALDGYYGGNKMYAAAAYNWGKSNVDKWIAKGADFNQLPKETQGYLQRIKPETLPSMTARSAPPPAQEVGPATMEPPPGISASAAPVTPARSAATSVAPAVATAPAARAEDLGSGYKAALALSFLGSEDKDRPTTDSELEDRLNETALAEFNKELEDYTPKNALADMELTALNPAKFMQPVKMADGGEVDKSENRGFFSRLFGGSTDDFIERTKSKAQENEDYRAMLDYLQSRDAVPDVKTGFLPYGIDAAFSAMKLPLVGAVGSGSIKLNEDLAEAPEWSRKRKIGPSTLAHEMAHAADRQFEQQAREQTGIFSKGNNFTDAYEKMVGSGGMREGRRRTDLARRYHPEWAAANSDYRSTPYEIAAHGVGKYAGPTSADDAPPHVDATAATEFQILLDLARRNSKEGNVSQTELDPANRPAFVTPKSGIGRRRGPISRMLNADAPVRRSNGSPETGEVALTPEEIAEASRPATFNRNIARQGAAARDLAAMRDVNTLPDPRTYAAVSGFLGQAPDQMGFSVMHPNIQGIKRAGEVGFATGLVPAVAPVVAPIARAAGRAATALGMRAEKALDAPVTRTLEGGGRSADMLKALGAQPSFAVRPKGGHFELRPDASGPGMAVWDDVKQTVSDTLANTKDQPLNNWFNTKYSAYLRRDFAAEGDPFVKAADAGKKLHIPNQPLDEDWQTTLNFVRKREGLPSQGFATTPYGKNVEDALDASLNIRELGDLANSPYSINKIPSGIRQFSDTNPEMRVYSLDEIMESGPRAESLRNTMLEMRQPSVSYYGESIAIPKNYQLTNETLQGLSPVQASERAALFSEWKDTARQKAATLSVRKNKNISKQDAGDGYLWVNPPDLSANPQIRQIVQDVGCDGGWCTQQERFAMDYGSGNSRLSILLDNKSRPVAQMTIDDLGPPDPKDFIKSLSPQEIAAFRSNPLYRNIQDDELHLFADSFPQYDQYVRNAPPSISITEIKARGNKADVVNTVSSIDLRKIQDQVKDLDSRFDLQYVQNLKGIGLHEVPRKNPNAVFKHFSLSQDDRLALKNKFGSEAEGVRAILAKAIDENGGSKYFSGNEDEMFRHFQSATRSLLQPPVNRAKGGMVERQSTDNRAYL